MGSFKNKILAFFKSFSSIFINFVQYFIKGNINVKLSYLIMGWGCFTYKQWHRGVIYLVSEIGFIYYLFTNGINALKMLPTLGTVEQGQVWDEVEQIFRYSHGDNSMLCLLFGVVAICMILIFVVVYYMNIKNAITNEELFKNGKKINGMKEDIALLLNEKFHITVLALPTVTTVLLTVIPIFFMLLIAFTNYDKFHLPPGNLFTWVGFNNFANVLWKNPLQSSTFIKLLMWTFVWAICATFVNYICGMILAMLINKKGVKWKSFWRTMFVITIAVPQFVSLLLMSKLLADTGAVNDVFRLLGMNTIPFLTNGTTAKITVIIINLWVGIPYTMLITSGILMNIPQDLYESAKIDGAGPITQFTKITLPYMIHVTTPYLITQFIGNINNFNVIYLLTLGGPFSLNYYQAGETDLLITWLYKLTTNEQNYALASVIGILIFIICSVLSLITFNKSNAVKKEDEFQ